MSYRTNDVADNPSGPPIMKSFFTQTQRSSIISAITLHQRMILFKLLLFATLVVCCRSTTETPSSSPETPFGENVEKNQTPPKIENDGWKQWLQANVTFGTVIFWLIIAICAAATTWIVYGLAQYARKLNTPCRAYTTARGATAPKVYKQLRSRWKVLDGKGMECARTYRLQYPERMHLDEMIWWKCMSQRIRELEGQSLKCAQYFHNKEYEGEEVPPTTDLSEHFAAECDAIEIFASNVKDTVDRWNTKSRDT